MFPSARARPVLALHAFVLSLIALFIAFLELKQENPFKKHYATMVAILIDLFIYAMIVLLSFNLEGFAEEVATSISILLGLLSSQLLILIMVPILGWICLVLWVIFLLIVVYKLLSGWNREPPQQPNPFQNHVGIQEDYNGPQANAINIPQSGQFQADNQSQDQVIIPPPAQQDYNQSQAHAIIPQPVQFQEYNQSQSQDDVTIEMTKSLIRSTRN